MSPMSRLRAMAYLSTGLSMAEVSRLCGVHKSTICRLQKKRLELGEEAAAQNKPGSGRPSIVSLGDVSRVLRIIKKYPFFSAVRVKRLLGDMVAHLSVRMIQKLCVKAGYRAHQAARKPMLNERMRLARVAFAVGHLHWTPDQWMKVMFSDESTFRLVRGSKKTVRRRSGSDRYAKEYVVKTVKHSGSVMVWGCFDGFRGRAGLSFLPKDVTMNAVRYVETLEDHLIEWYHGRGNQWLLQDSAPCHRAHLTRDFLVDQGIRTIDWPGNSPDLNPIENLWHIMKCMLEQREVTSVPQMKDFIKTIWCTRVTRELCANLARSMPNRLQAVINAEGGPTKY